MKLRIGTRDSRLAMIQAQQFIQQLNRVRPDIQTETVALKTTGDKILDRTLDQVGGKGLFVKELDQALLENQADLTVHCVKDLPAELNMSMILNLFCDPFKPLHHSKHYKHGNKADNQEHTPSLPDRPLVIHQRAKEQQEVADCGSP